MIPFSGFWLFFSFRGGDSLCTFSDSCAEPSSTSLFLIGGTGSPRSGSTPVGQAQGKALQSSALCHRAGAVSHLDHPVDQLPPVPPPPTKPQSKPIEISSGESRSGSPLSGWPPAHHGPGRRIRRRLFHPPGEKMKRKGKEMEEEREDEKMDIEDVWCSRRELQVVVVLILVVALPKMHPSVLISCLPRILASRTRWCTLSGMPRASTTYLRRMITTHHSLWRGTIRSGASLPPCLPASVSPYLPTSLPPCLPASLPPCLPASLPTSLPLHLCHWCIATTQTLTLTPTLTLTLTPNLSSILSLPLR